MYAVIEVHNAGQGDPPVPSIKGKYGVYVVPLSALGETMQEFSESFDPCQGVLMTVTVQDWTKEQADGFLDTVNGGP